MIRLILFDNSKIKNGNKSARYIANVLLLEYDSVWKSKIKLFEVSIELSKKNKWKGMEKDRKNTAV